MCTFTSEELKDGLLFNMGAPKESSKNALGESQFSSTDKSESIFNRADRTTRYIMVVKTDTQYVYLVPITTANASGIKIDKDQLDQEGREMLEGSDVSYFGTEILRISKDNMLNWGPISKRGYYNFGKERDADKLNIDSRITHRFHDH